LDYPEVVSLMALRYASHIQDGLRDERAARYATALRYVQAAVYDQFRTRHGDAGRPLPSAVAGLAFEVSNPDAEVPLPAVVPGLSKEDAAVPLMSLLSTNVIRPFEIEVPDKVRKDAAEALSLEMGLGRQFGSDAFEAAEQAQKVLSVRRGGWVKWVALGVGGAAVVATGGLALAAAPAGLAGAAAITSALAAFGPGGMMGGLLTAGALVTVGSGGLAAGLASPSTSAEAVEAVITMQLRPRSCVRGSNWSRMRPCGRSWRTPGGDYSARGNASSAFRTTPRPGSRRYG